LYASKIFSTVNNNGHLKLERLLSALRMFESGGGGTSTHFCRQSASVKLYGLLRWKGMCDRLSGWI